MGVTLRHTSIVNTYVTQCPRDDLGVPSIVHVEKSWMSRYLDVEEVDPVIATTYEGLINCHMRFTEIIIEVSYVSLMLYRMLLDVA